MTNDSALVLLKQVHYTLWSYCQSTQTGQRIIRNKVMRRATESFGCQARKLAICWNAITSIQTNDHIISHDNSWPAGKKS
jgi:hypothetical protein